MQNYVKKKFVQKYANKYVKYAKYALKYAKKNMQKKYAKKYVLKYAEYVIKYAKYVLSIENDMCCQKYAKYAIKYAEHAKYVILKKICRICTPHFADDTVTVAAGTHTHTGTPGDWHDVRVPLLKF
jgi:hypothetical protein